MPDITTILFIDLDGTIIQGPYKAVALPVVLDELSRKTGQPPEALGEAILAEFHHRLDHPFPDDPPRVMDWDDINAAVAARHGVTLEAVASALVRQNPGPPHAWPLDDAGAVLRELANGRRKLVVATMGLSKYQFPVLEALGLRDRFDAFLMPDLTGFLKTDRRFYESIYRQYPAATYINVGDYYWHDVLVPKQLGHLSIFKADIPALADLPPLARPGQLEPFKGELYGEHGTFSLLPDAVIRHLSELPAVVAALERAAVRADG